MNRYWRIVLVLLMILLTLSDTATAMIPNTDEVELSVLLSKDIRDYFIACTQEEEGPLVDAVVTDIFMSNNCWYWGIYSDTHSLSIIFRQSDETDDAILLNGHFMLDAAAVIDEHDVAGIIYCAVQYAHEQTLTTYQYIGDPYFYRNSHSYQYVSVHFVFDYAIQMGYTDMWGNEIVTEYYGMIPYQNGCAYSLTVEEFFSLILPSQPISSIEMYKVDNTYSENEISDPGLLEVLNLTAKSQYEFPTQNGLKVLVSYDPKTRLIYNYYIEPTNMDDKPLLYDYFRLFIQISSMNLPIEIVDILQCRNGEEFTWRDIISMPYPHPVTAYFFCDKWCMVISDNDLGLPCVQIYPVETYYHR